MKNQSLSLMMLMTLLLISAFSGCAQRQPVYIDRPMYIQDLDYVNDTNYTTSKYSLRVIAGEVNVPVPLMRQILDRIKYFKMEARVKDEVIESYSELIQFNNKLSKEFKDESE